MRNDHRNYFMSNLTKVWEDRAGIELGTPRSAVRLTSVAKHVTDCDTRPRLFVCFVALGPKSTVMVMAGWSAHLTILFPGQA